MATMTTMSTMTTITIIIKKIIFLNGDGWFET